VCGLAGEFNYGSAPTPDVEVWRRIVERMHRRGPDAIDIWADGHHALLGSTRLAVMDPSGCATLPLKSGDGRYVLAYNGEIYDFADMRDRLTRRGWVFRTRSDSEVVLAALATWGVDVLPQFNGMFALGFYDTQARSLLLARDVSGIKPLYAFEHAAGVLFGSELDGLLLHPGMRGSAVERESIEMYLRLGHIPAPHGLVRGASMLEPGTWRRYAVGRVLERGRYFAFPSSGESLLRGAEADEAIEVALSNAVRRHLVSDVPVGVLLSGGVDSPLVAGLAASEHSGISTFTVGTDDLRLDESETAAAFARAFGTSHHTVSMNATDAVGLVAEVLDATCEPMADEGMFPALAVARLASQEVTVVLTGDGSDELFMGYVQRQLPMLGVPWDGHYGETYLRYHNDFARGDFARLFPNTAWWPQGVSPYDNVRSGMPMDWMRKTEFDAYLPFILLKADRSSMYHSLEVRVPFLDQEVIRVALRIDPSHLLDAGTGLGKLPLRRLLRRLSGLDTPGKRGFTVPMDDWIRGPLREVTYHALHSLRGLEEVEVDRDEVGKLFARHCTGQVDAGMALWRLVLLDLWFGKVHDIRAAIGRP